MKILVQELAINPSTNLITTLLSGLIGAVIGGLISGLITRHATFFVDKQARNRWLKDGYLKRRIDLEVQISKYLLGIKSNCFTEINEDRLNTLLKKDRFTQEDKNEIVDLNTRFEKLYEYINYQESNRSGINIEDFRYATIVNEYLLYSNELEEKFRVLDDLTTTIFDEKTIFKNGNSKSPANVLYPVSLEELNADFEKIKMIVSTYLELYNTLVIILDSISKNMKNKTDEN